MRFEGGGGEDYEFWGWGGGGGFVVLAVGFAPVVFDGLVIVLVQLERSEHGARLFLRDATVRDVVLGGDAEEDGARVADARSEESGVGQLAFVK